MQHILDIKKESLKGDNQMSNAWICLNLKQFFFIQCESTAIINGAFPIFLFLISWADP